MQNINRWIYTIDSTKVYVYPMNFTTWSLKMVQS